ncbi:sugar-binding transcriptional regulator [Paenibacillus sp. CGMCC 1.16610]|uniref:Helix-turn-helix domain-containing protein n=1 Tax=Paenibacillus anseongense TaxID=2682845 RepID=A0ABW9UIW4_9BACL|nr:MULTISPECIES: sugar-binding transcriptional regulator [Paenibacillus]MBA2939434.1 sugar-binding transcriptional regulator [Paenibacillus sp. CGMCC 1.16610]MVQ39098.1 helix-turn-helix domain-containing protein [Paenibacillus anseongense]
MGGDKLEKIVDAARMYYQLDYSQQDIAKKLGVSRPTVSRFLQQAKEEGIVQIKIMDPTENKELLAEQLEAKFRLKKAVVASVPEYEDHIVKKYIGEAAAVYLDEVVKDGDTIAMTWGTTLYEVASHLPNKLVKDVTVVQLNGGVSYSETNTYASEIIHLFGNAFNTTPHLLPLPAIVDHAVVKQAIEADRHIRKILEIGKRANIAVFTVGVPSEDSVLIKANYFSEADLEIIHAKGAGDICSRFIDLEGRVCSEALNLRTIGIDLAELRTKEKSILVAGGMKKVEAIYSVIKGNYTNTLITDQFTAQHLLAYANEQSQ